MCLYYLHLIDHEAFENTNDELFIIVIPLPDPVKCSVK